LLIDKSKEELPRPGQISDQDDAIQAMAAIKDPGVAVSDKVSKRRRPEPSVITDLGNHMYATQLQRSRQFPTSYDRSPGPLNEKLHRAMREAPGLPGKFCPNIELLRLIEEESVAMELERHERALRIRKESASKASQKKQNRVLSLPNRAIEAGRSVGSGIRNRVLSIEHRSDKTVALARQICGSQPSEGGQRRTYRKIFAILVMIEMPHKIKHFLKEGIWDEDLPLTKRVVSGQFKLFRRRTSNMLTTEKTTLSGGQKSEGGLLAHLLDRRVEKPEKPLRCFRGWDSNRRGKFEEKQWAMVAPFFGRGEPGDSRPVRHYRLQPQVVLPFTLWEGVGHGGAFGQVYKVEIHKEHHSFDIPEVLIPPP